MEQFKFKRLNLEGAYLIDCFSAGDNRGGFIKCFEKDLFEREGISFSLNETFCSVSAKNVIRGLHFQLYHPQMKLITVPYGKAYDVIVDLRKDSATYMQWQGVELSADNRKALLVPRGYAHGFMSLEDNTIMMYQCDGEYDAETDTGIRFDDPHIGIVWPVDNLNDVICSSRDLTLMSFEEFRGKGFVY